MSQAVTRCLEFVIRLHIAEEYTRSIDIANMHKVHTNWVVVQVTLPENVLVHRIDNPSQMWLKHSETSETTTQLMSMSLSNHIAVLSCKTWARLV